MSETIKATKGFNEDMTCRDFQYKVGAKFFHPGSVMMCSSGFHSCERPVDVFRYYPPRCSVYCEVIASGEIVRHDDKIASSEIEILKPKDIGRIIAETAQLVKNNCGYQVDSSASTNIPDMAATAVGERGMAISLSAATAGNEGAALVEKSGTAVAGNKGAACCTDNGVAVAGEGGVAITGADGIAAACNFGGAKTGDRGVSLVGCNGAAITQDMGVAVAALGGFAKAGFDGVAVAGPHGKAVVSVGGIAVCGKEGVAQTDERGVAFAWNYGRVIVGRYGIGICGIGGQARGEINATIIFIRNNHGLRSTQTIVIDGESYKPGVWYKLVTFGFNEGEVIPIDEAD